MGHFCRFLPKIAKFINGLYINMPGKTCLGDIMYINRKGIVNNTGIKGTMKDMMFDIESMFLVAGKDAVDIFYDVYEDIIDLRWDLFVYRMHRRGLLSEEEAGLSRTSFITSSILGTIFFSR